MQYKTIVHELLQQQTQLHENLRLKRRLLPAIEAYAKELKASHEEWKETLSQARPGSDPIQIASEAMEMAVQEMEDRLQSESQVGDQEALSLDAAMAFLKGPTSRG
ncbi:MAG TPA: hypothetical protein PK867_15700 [Pirellulales bacterium]|nr:hypothetical protein [Pirellulales bacterium]